MYKLPPDKFDNLYRFICNYADEENWHPNMVMGYWQPPKAEDFGKLARLAIEILDSLEEVPQEEPWEIVDRERGKV